MARLKVLSEDFFGRLHRRRDEVEKYLPLPSPELTALHGGQEPNTVEVISSQSFVKPSTQTIERAFVEQSEISQPARLALFRYKQMQERNEALRAARDKINNKTPGEMIAMLPPDSESPEAAELRRRRDAIVSRIPQGDKPGDDKGKHAALADELEAEQDKLIGDLIRFHFPREAKIVGEYFLKLQALELAAEQEQHKTVDPEPKELIELVNSHFKNVHGIPIEKGQTHLFQGGSWVVLAQAVGAVARKGQYIVAPELHWDGYNVIPDHFGVRLLDVPRARGLEEYLLEKFGSKKGDSIEAVRKKVGCILLTHPCSITGKRYSDDELREYLSFSKKYQIPLVVNEIYASPEHDGTPFNSITRLPEFEEVKDLVLISSSLTKTFNQLNLKLPKLAYFWSANKQWADTVRQATIPYTQTLGPTEFCQDYAVLKGTPASYFRENEAAYNAARKRMTALMEEANAAAGRELLSWTSCGEPRAGHTAAVQINPDIAAKAGIKDSVDLWEYVYKVAGVNAGPVFFSGDSCTPSKKPLMALRVNYSVPPAKLELAVKGLAFAAQQMDRGLTFRKIKDKHGDLRPEYNPLALMQKMLAEYGSDAVREEGAARAV